MAEIGPNTRLRVSPFYEATVTEGVAAFSPYNRMLMPTSYGHPREEYDRLTKGVSLWDVAVERQVAIEGPDAATFTQMLCTRDLSGQKIGQGKYVACCDHRGVMVNDPVVLKLAEDRFWLSIADSDLLLYVKGLIIGRGFDAMAFEPDVNPMDIQGPKAEALMVDLFGPAICELKFYRYMHVDFQGTRQLVARSGFSSVDGFEIYLDDSSLGPVLWDTVVEAGQKYNIAPGGPNQIDRIEGGLLGFGNEMTNENNPLEMGFGKFCRLDGSIDCIGLDALRRIDASGLRRTIRGVRFEGPQCPVCMTPWPVMAGEINVGQITSAVWSPGLRSNVGLSLIDRDHWEQGRPVTVLLPDGSKQEGTVQVLPFKSS